MNREIENCRQQPAPRRLLMSIVLAAFTGDPKHVVFAMIVAGPGEHEQQVGEPVQINGDVRVDWMLLGQKMYVDFNASANGAGVMQMGRRGAAARKDETFERFERLVDSVDTPFQPLGLG